MALEHELNQAGFPDASPPLAAARATLDRKGLNVLVLGRFSVGKSTLINAFLGYPVLPGGLTPTTGAICHLAHGAPGAAITFSDGRVETFPGPEALPTYLSLDPQQPGSMKRLEGIRRVDITLPLPLLEDGLEITDSPGLDEASTRTGAAISALDAADVTLFVLAADQLMSEIEREFLASEALPRGPGAIALVINFWDRIPAGEEPAVLSRLEALAAELGENAARFSGGFAAGDGVSCAPPFRCFTISAARAVRLRWRPGSARVGASGIEELESWLREQSAAGESVRSRAFSGRTRYALRRAMVVVEQEQRGLPGFARQNDLAVAAARAVCAAIETAARRVVEVAAASQTALVDSLGVRIASGVGALKESFTRRLEKNPYDPLYNLPYEIDQWWRGVETAVQGEAGAELIAMASCLDEGGVLLTPGDLPELRLTVPAPAVNLQLATDRAAPAKETITGLFGSISQSAADSAAGWMKKASKYTANLDPQARQRLRVVSENLDNSVSLAAYKVRREAIAWTDSLKAVAIGMLATARESGERQLAERSRSAEETRRRMQRLADLMDELQSLERDIGE